MCGITGWVEFGRDLTPEREVLEAMTGALGNRGVDGRGVWLHGCAGLGHTRTAIIDVAGGAQPMVAAEDGRVLAVISYNGEVYNFTSLRSELQARGHRFRTRSDTEVVLRSYLQWGDDCASHLEGIFAFAVWDPRREKLLLARDRLGVKPLFYSLQPAGVLFGSEPKALLANPLVRPVVDIAGLRELFATAKKPGQSVFRDMKELRPGHTLAVSRDGAADRTYWRIEARPHRDDLKTTIATVRGMLEEIVPRELVSDVPLCTALSGGIDSSTITALAAGWRKRNGGERIRTFVTTFDRYARNFQPDDVRFSPDEPFATEVARHVGSDHVNIMLDTDALMDPATRQAALVAQDMPTTLGDMDTSNYVTCREIKKHSTVAVSGEVADEIFGGYNWMFVPELLDSGIFPWAANELRQPGSPDGQGRGLFDPGLLRQLDMAGYYTGHYRQALTEVPHQEDEDATERQMRSLSYITLTWWLPLLMDRDDRLSMAHGLELRVPFADHRLVEYMYNTPWRLKTFDGREKSILRAAARDLLPSSVLDRAKSPWPVTQDPAYAKMLDSELAALISDPASPILPYLSLGAAKRTLSRPQGTGNEWISRMHVEMALQFDAWLRNYHIELAL
jgi:asparagine synthase (glutamine-hydrolysing)